MTIVYLILFQLIQICICYQTKRSNLLMGKGFGKGPDFIYSGKLRPGKESPKSLIPQNILK